MSQLRTNERISLGAILATMTTFGLLFGALRMINADAPVYLYFGSLAMATLAAQMLFGVTSKLGSALLGGLLLPVSLLGYSAWLGEDMQNAATGLPCTVVLGSLFGFCTSVMTAGVYTLLQMGQAFLMTRRVTPNQLSEEQND